MKSGKHAVTGLAEAIVMSEARKRLWNMCVRSLFVDRLVATKMGRRYLVGAGTAGIGSV